MNTRGWIAAALALVLVGEALAQRQRAVISRPTTQTGSALLGRLGGDFTVQTDVQSLIARNRGGGTGISGALGQTRRFGAAGNLGRLPNPAVPAALSSYRPSIFRYAGRPEPFPMFSGAPDEWELQQVTGFNATTDFDMPVSGWSEARFYRDPGALNYTINRPSDPVDAFFNVTQVRELPAFKPEPDQRTMIDHLDAKNEAYAEQLRADAVREFKRGTRSDVDDRHESIARAIDALKAFRDFGYREPDMALLLVHAALLQGRTLQAITELETAAEAHLDLIRERDELREYFASDQVYRDHLRDYVLELSTQDDSPALLTLRAYCAWRLGDSRRFEAALNGLEARRDRLPPEALERLRRIARLLRIADATSGPIQ